MIVTQTPRAGWAVATDAGETVAIDTTVTPELRREGLAREVIRLIQEARKNDGLDVTDRIALRWSARDPADLWPAAALTEHAALIAGEVLAVEFGPAEADVAGLRPVTCGNTRTKIWACGSGSGGPEPARYSGRLVGLVREAGAARGAAAFRAAARVILSRSLSPMKRMRMQWALWYLGTPGTTVTSMRGVQARGFGFGGWLVLLRPLGLRGRGSAGGRLAVTVARGPASVRARKPGQRRKPVRARERAQAPARKLARACSSVTGLAGGWSRAAVGEASAMARRGAGRASRPAGVRWVARPTGRASGRPQARPPARWGAVTALAWAARGLPRRAGPEWWCRETPRHLAPTARGAG